MNADILRRYLTNRERALIPERGFSPAAVLLPLVLNGSLQLLLTRRSTMLPRHPGEMSFPGGRVEPGDGDRLRAALRETEEEIGVPAHEIDVLGALDDALSISDFHIVPYVGVIPYRDRYAFDRNEIEDVHLVPVQRFLSPPGTLEYEHDGANRRGIAWTYNGHRIFGVTAGIIQNFVEILERSGFLAEHGELIA